MWYSKTNQDVVAELHSNLNTGLSETEAKKRLEQHGPNKLKAKKKKNLVQMFFGHLKDWLIYVLLAAVVITIFMQEYIDAVIILAVIFVNAILGVVQEVKAGKAIEALQKMSSPKALVRRDGQVKEIDSEYVVPGDILILDAGRYIAADVRLLETANMQVEESALTGESVPAEKDANKMHEPKTVLGDQENMAFMSTLVTYGRGVGIAVGTGMNTEMGKIANILENEEEIKTPLEIRLSKLGKTLGKIAVAVCILFFVLAWFQGRDLAEMFLTAVSLAVASIPEGLAAIVAVVLSIGVTNMAKKNAIIKRLPAVETLGSVNIVCSDKTGTLTQNKMTVTKVFTLEGEIALDKNTAATPEAQILAKNMILCSDATLENGVGTGDPTEIALLDFGDKIGVDRKKINADNKRLAEYAFDSDRKLMSVLTEENGKHTVYTKGAVDNLQSISTHVYYKGKAIPVTEEHLKLFDKATETFSNQALRTLGAAHKEVNGVIPNAEMEKNLVLTGLVGMIDPPREEVKPSIQLAKDAGIRVIMITGDYKNTAFAIAKELGIAENMDQAITGKEIDSIAEEEFTRNINNYRVFARVSPEHKVKIVRALKAHKNVVSMTGDGVNDAPSLNAADIGVAMGITGTDVAKGASDMILTDDNFSTIISAVEQGRNIYNNIKKAVIFLLTCNLGEVVAMFVTILLGWKAPLLATQLLWINLVTDSLPAVALGMDPGDPDVMKEKPRDKNENFFAGGAGVRAVAGGIIIGLVTIIAYWFGFYENGYSPFDSTVPENIVEYARTLAFITIISCQLFYSLAIRSSRKSIFKIGVFSNKYLVGAIVLGLFLQFIVLGIPALQDAFKLQMPDATAFVMVVFLGLVPLILNELYKLILRLKTK